MNTSMQRHIWERRTRRVRDTEVQDFACFYERVEGLHDLRNGGRVVPPDMLFISDADDLHSQRTVQMEIEQVDVACLQLLETVLDLVRCVSNY